jgi:hypothetical protein
MNYTLFASGSVLCGAAQSQEMLAFLPTTVVMGTLSVRYSERLRTRFGPRRTLLPGHAFRARRP